MGEKKKIFIVEDEADLRDILVYKLKASGFEVESEEDGAKAVNKIKDFSPDLVILDIMLPNVDGLKICKILKSDTKLKAIPVIIFSASSVQDGPELVEKARADAYISKPFEFKELLDIINRLIAL